MSQKNNIYATDIYKCLCKVHGLLMKYNLHVNQVPMPKRDRKWMNRYLNKLPPQVKEEFIRQSKNLA